ncbi:MAG: hypothetical protein RL088_3876 [Verrucomicrobiota bacterium]|jgi:outer membrane biosynthesis protein TonB
MKSLLLVLVTAPLFAQEPAPASAPAAPQPLAPAEPAKPEAAEKPSAPELPERSTAPRDDKLLDLLRKNPTPEGRREMERGPRLEPKPAVKEAEKPTKADPSRDKSRNTLLPPATSTDLDLRVRYRKARTVAERDPAVVAAWEESRAARTDYAKRESLKRYYDLIRAKVLAIDRAVAPLLEERHRFSSKKLDQTRVDPTDPLAEDLRHQQ